MQNLILITKIMKKDYKAIFETMVQETQKYLENNNLFAMILGISGGLDSTVTAAICHEVEKRNPELKFYGISLPCSSNLYRIHSYLNVLQRIEYPYT